VVFIPIVFAGIMSLSILSPTIILSSGLHLHFSNIASKYAAKSLYNKELARVSLKLDFHLIRSEKIRISSLPLPVPYRTTGDLSVANRY
jgi:hypothetical protein